jgi:hypothetical protein
MGHSPLDAHVPSANLYKSVRTFRLYVVLVIGTISRKTSDSTDKLNGQNPLDIAVTNALELLRGQNFEN